MNRRVWTVVLIVTLGVAAVVLYCLQHGWLTQLLGAIVCVWAIVDTLRKPASLLSKSLSVVGLLLWFVYLGGSALDLLPQGSGLVGLVFPCGFCLVAAGILLGSKGRTPSQ